MMNLKDAETRVTIGDSRTLNGTKRGDCHGYQKRDGKIHCKTLSDAAIITGLDENILSMAQTIQTFSM